MAPKTLASTRTRRAVAPPPRFGFTDCVEPRHHTANRQKSKKSKVIKPLPQQRRVAEKPRKTRQTAAITSSPRVTAGPRARKAPRQKKARVAPSQRQHRPAIPSSPSPSPPPPPPRSRAPSPEAALTIADQAAAIKAALPRVDGVTALPFIEILQEPLAWSAVENAHTELIALLPASQQRSELQTHDEWLIKLLKKPALQGQLRAFQRVLELGMEDGEWRSGAQMARRERAEGRFDESKVENSELWWGQRMDGTNA